MPGMGGAIIFLVLNRLDSNRWTGAAWKIVVTAQAIGHKKIDDIPPVIAGSVRLNILSNTDAAAIREFQLYNVKQNGEPK
jgi:alpha-L-fucosidase